MVKDMLWALGLAVFCLATGMAIHLPGDGTKVLTDTPASAGAGSSVTVPVTSSEEIIEVIDLRKFKSMREEGSLIVIDVRDEEVFLRGHIPGARNYPLKAYDSLRTNLLKDLQAGQKPVVLYCGSKSCQDSGLMADQLAGDGIPHSRLRVYKGGWIDWALNRGKIETGPAKKSLPRP